MRKGQDLRETRTKGSSKVSVSSVHMIGELTYTTVYVSGYKKSKARGWRDASEDKKS